MAEHVLADDARPGDSPARKVEIRLARHRVELVGYCYRMLGSAFVAEDAVQETLLRAWRSYDRFDERRSAWRSWLLTIATNVCFDKLRSAQRRTRGGSGCLLQRRAGLRLPAGRGSLYRSGA